MRLNVKWLGFCMMLILSGCGSVNYMDIQTYNPAVMTFPKEVGKVLIVNNTVTQSSDEGYEFKVYGDKQKTQSLSKDSAMVKVVNTLGYSIADASYFEDVLLYNEKVKNHGTGSASEALTAVAVSNLCTATGADAIISWDGLKFDVKRTIEGTIEGFLEEIIDIRIHGVVRAYVPDRKTPLAEFQIEDSLFFNEMAYDPSELAYIMPSTEEALLGAAEYIANKQVPNFVPHWSNEKRWLYNEGSSRWREASAYASNGEWEKAAERWQRLYANSTNQAKKAKAASNLALYHEMKTDLQSAYEWADRSCRLLEEKKEEELHDLEMQELYRSVLAQRIELNKKLNMQIGEE